MILCIVSSYLKEKDLSVADKHGMLFIKVNIRKMKSMAVNP